jgi:DNA-binding GntR family transcriptional regulator
MSRIPQGVDDRRITSIATIARPETLSRQAYSAVRKAVRDGVIVPGTFYSEVQIAKVLGISRTPVRESLIELAREGIVDKVPQRGFRLRSVSDAERQEVFGLRSLLESDLAQRLAMEATDEDIRTLRRILSQQARLRSDVSAFLEVDEEFHLAGAALLGLPRTRAVLLTLRGIMWISGLAATARSRRIDDVLREHRAILDAISSRDPVRASQAAIDHIVSTAHAAQDSSAQRHSVPSGHAAQRRRVP